VTEQEYHQALEQTHIQSGEGWNQRYLEALWICGLELVPWRDDDERRLYYLEAPLPVPNQSPSWGRSLIVPINQ
jgi:hypothetical protein